MICVNTFDNSSSKTSKKRSISASKKRPVSSVYDDDNINTDDLGVETEAEKQIKAMLEKQLSTDTSLKTQFAQHRSFTCPSTYKSLTELVKGACSLKEFKEIEADEEIRQELQRCGLNDDEITCYLAFKTGKGKGKCLMDPVIWNNNIQRIVEKIKAHNEDLMKPQNFSNVKKLSRHEMDIEKTLYAGCSDKKLLSSLLTEADDSLPADIASAFSYVKSVSQELLEKCKKKRKTAKKSEISILPENIEVGSTDFKYDANIHHVIVPLNESEIAEKKLSSEEIRKLPHFQSYEAGKPNKVLYLKNLHPKVTLRELQSIFARFEEENESVIHYKICTGRMKGQAFLQFTDFRVAEKALRFANGYILKGKPIIIEYGHKS